jgi:hypothetical protein
MGNSNDKEAPRVAAWALCLHGDAPRRRAAREKKQDRLRKETQAFEPLPYKNGVICRDTLPLRTK